MNTWRPLCPLLKPIPTRHLSRISFGFYSLPLYFLSSKSKVCLWIHRLCNIMLSFDFHMHGLFFPLSFGVFDDDQDVVVGLLSDWFFLFIYFYTFGRLGFRGMSLIIYRVLGFWFLILWGFVTFKFLLLGCAAFLDIALEKIKIQFMGNLEIGEVNLSWRRVINQTSCRNCLSSEDNGFNQHIQLWRKINIQEPEWKRSLAGLMGCIIFFWCFWSFKCCKRILIYGKL